MMYDPEMPSNPTVVSQGQKSQRVILSHFWNPAIIAFTPLPTAATEIQLFEGGLFDH